MKVVRYLTRGKEKYGALVSEKVIPIPKLGRQRNRALPATVEAFIADETAQETVERLLKTADIGSASIPLSEVQLLAPIVFPPKILCLGWNYQDHIEETKRQLPEEPVVFMKPHTAIIGPDDKIIKRPFVNELDYEVELTIVIGKRAKDVPELEALDYVFGYTILDDVSARDFQFKDKQWTRGKGFDTFAPIGPCITTKSELSDTSNLSIKTWINSEIRQDGSTKDMIFNVSQIIYHLSRVMTLEPCDIIATGTPSGVAMAMKPPKWLKNGDMVKMEIEGIGTLQNTVLEA